MLLNFKAMEHPVMQRFKPFILIAALAVTGCSEDPKTAIIGSWEGVTMPQDFEFYADGQAELIDRKHGTYEGNCSISDGDQLTCHFDRFAYPVKRTVRISGNRLYMSNRNGQEEIYQRM